MNKKQSLTQAAKNLSYSTAAKQSNKILPDRTIWPDLKQNLGFRKQSDIINIGNQNITVQPISTRTDNETSGEYVVAYSNIASGDEKKHSSRKLELNVQHISSEPHDDSDGWITIRSQKKRNTHKNSAIKAQISNQSDKTGVNRVTEIKTSNINERDAKADGDNLPTITDELRKKAREVRKQRIKDEKKRKREEKARILRESLRRDTKITIISHDVIESLQKASNKMASYSQQSNQESLFNKTLEEYPSLCSSKDRSSLTVKKISLQSHKSERAQSSKMIPHSINTKYEKSKFVSDSNISRSSVISSYSSAAANKIVKDQQRKATQLTKASDNGLTQAYKRKVKTTDGIQLDFEALIEAKKKQIKSKAVYQIAKKRPLRLVIEKHHGKKREGKPKKLSSLRKNLIKEKKRQAELLLWLLKECKRNQIAERQLELDSHCANKVEVDATCANKEELDSNCANKDELDSNCANKVEVDSNCANKDEVDANCANKEELDSTCANKENETNQVLKETTTITAETCPSKHQIATNDSPSSEKTIPPVGATDDIINEIKILINPFHTRKFREYCHHVLTPEIDEVLKELIQLLVKFQDRLYKTDPIKAKMKRRFYCGLKESLKHMNRLSCLIMAPNLKPSPGTGCVDELVSKVLSRAEETGVPVMFGLSHRQLGRLCFKKVPVSCFAIVNYQGAQEKFHRLMELVPEAKKQYELLVASRPREESDPLREDPSDSIIQKLKA